MFGVKIDRDDPLDLHEQVAAEIRRAIADGEAKSGERLPPAKNLAAVLDVSTNTVLRALRQLRDEGLLEFRRGRGITVAGTPESGAVVAQATDLVRLDQTARVPPRGARQDHRRPRLKRPDAHSPAPTSAKGTLREQRRPKVRRIHGSAGATSRGLTPVRRQWTRASEVLAIGGWVAPLKHRAR